MKKIISTIILLVIIGIQPLTAQRKGAEPQLDEKKLAKANGLIEEAMGIDDRGKKTETLYKAMEYFREMRMTKEGSIAIGDAFFNKGDLDNAARWYSKGGKQYKVETSKKIGESYLENALSEEDPKTHNKLISKSVKYLSKAFGYGEAYRQVGNEYFDKGEEFYPQALLYYQKAKYEEGVFIIGDLYAAKGGDFEKAAVTYACTGTNKGYKKAGDLYFNKGDYSKAMSYYVSGGVVEGYLKYAKKLKEAGMTNEYNKVCIIIADSLVSRNRTDDVRTMAVSAEKDQNYHLANELYSKIGDDALANKYKAYSLLSEMNFMEAKAVFEEIQNDKMVTEIDNNIEVLTDLQQLDLTMQELQKEIPEIHQRVNKNTGKYENDQRDVELQKKYYNNKANQKKISESVYKIGDRFKDLNSGFELRKIVSKRFLSYKPVAKILDSYSLSKKVMPYNITASAVKF